MNIETLSITLKYLNSIAILSNSDYELTKITKVISNFMPSVIVDYSNIIDNNQNIDAILIKDIEKLKEIIDEIKKLDQKYAIIFIAAADYLDLNYKLLKSLIGLKRIFLDRKENYFKLKKYASEAIII